MKFADSRMTTIAVLCGLTFVIGCGDDSASTKVSATPEAAFKSLQSDFASEDYEKAIGHLTDDSQSAMAGALTIGAGFVMMFAQDGSADELKKIMTDHGIDLENPSQETVNLNNPAAAMQAIGKKIKDRPKYIAAVMNWLKKHGQGGESDKFGKIASASLKDVKITGDKATAMVAIDGDSEPIEFRKVGDSWRIHLTDDMFSGGNSQAVEISSMDSGFDFISDNGDFTAFMESDELPPSEPISKTDYEASWKVVTPVQGKTAGDVVTEMAQQCNLELTGADEFAEQLAQPVTIATDAAQGKSRLQIIEDAANQAGLYPVYKLRSLTFKKGTRPLPVRFVGPFLLQIASIKAKAPNPTGTVRLSCIGVGLPTPVVSRIKELTGFGSGDSFEIAVAAVTSGTTDLRQSDGMGGFTAGPFFSKSAFRFDSNTSLMRLLRGVESIDVLKGSVDFSLISRVSSVKFKKEKETITKGDAQLTLKTWSTNVAISFEGIKPGKVSIIARDQSGAVLESRGTSSSSFGDKGQTSTRFDTKPASVEVSIVEETNEIKYPFEFTGIRIPDFEKMPVEMVELKFTGSAPLQFDFVKIVRKEFAQNVVFKITNNSNKQFRAFYASMDYLDATGKKLKDFPHANSGSQYPGPDEAKEMPLHMAFAPKETKRVNITLHAVDFSDGTRWKNESKP